MAILGPADLPVVLKVSSNQLKFHAISQLGHPVCLIEIGEAQMEQILRSTGDWISQYFPLEERYAFFMTQPLQAEYPIPEGAYWIRNVKWDPATTRIDDIFSAESFLFSHSASSFLLSNKGPKNADELLADKKLKLVTPFGLRKPLVRWNERKQPAVTIKTINDELTCTINHPIMCNGDYIPAGTCKVGDVLSDKDSADITITEVVKHEIDGSWSIQTNVGCYYVSTNCNQFYLVH